MRRADSKIILGSASPRRYQLLQAVFPDVVVRVKNVDEDFPSHLVRDNIPGFLAEQKANAFKGELKENEFLVTADTIVWFDNHALNKPDDADDALSMLRKLSGNIHQVFTGVCISTSQMRKVFTVESRVEFISASDELLKEYIEQYKPFDKAGSYGAQECLPDGMNPLSTDEINFLEKINQEDLFEKSLAVKHHAKVPLIKKIEGSYFNVMGLPLVELYEVLEKDFANQ
jgi:septum formation protein